MIEYSFWHNISKPEVYLRDCLNVCTHVQLEPALRMKMLYNFDDDVPQPYLHQYNELSDE